MGQHTHSAPSTTVCPERYLTSKNPVIMKYVNVPSKGHFSGQRSGSLSGQHFWEWMKLACCTRTPEHSRWMHGGVMLVLHFRAVSLLISTPLLYWFCYESLSLNRTCQKHLDQQFYFFCCKDLKETPCVFVFGCIYILYIKEANEDVRQGPLYV